MRHWYVSIRPTERAPLAAVRQWTAELAAAVKLPEFQASDLVLAVSELLSLTLSASLVPGQPLRLSGQMEEGILRMVLTWEGSDLPGVCADGSPLAGSANQQRYLIEQCVDHWHVDRKGRIGVAVLEMRVRAVVEEQTTPCLTLPLMPWIDLAWYRRNERAEVLIVEDDDLLRDTLADLLADAGYGVTEASHGREALGKLTRGLSPDLILLDLMTPVMDGWQFLQVARNDPSLVSAPVVVLSAAARDDEVLPGVADYLQKPCDERRLLETVTRWCRPLR